MIRSVSFIYHISGCGPTYPANMKEIDKESLVDSCGTLQFYHILFEIPQRHSFSMGDEDTSTTCDDGMFGIVLK